MDNQKESLVPNGMDLDPPAKGIIKGMKRKARKKVFEAIDKGWFGLTPLHTHVVVCGFPRSGSTLLLLIIESCIANVKTFGQERPAMGWHVQNELRNHPFLVSKKPDDILRIPELREFYSERKAKLQLVLTLRDPRAVLTSFHNRVKNDYYVSPERWCNTFNHFKMVSGSEDSVTIRYEDLINDPGSIQNQLSQLVGWDVKLPFEDFHSQASEKFKGEALNNLRPLDKSTLEKWRQPKHRDRIRTLLKEIPKLPEILIELSYEQNKKLD